MASPTRQGRSSASTRRWPEATTTPPSSRRAEQGWVYQPGQFDRITAPTLLLAGTDSVPAVADATVRAAAAIPGAAIHPLEGHRHFAHKTDPAMVTALIQRFVAT